MSENKENKDLNTDICQNVTDYITDRVNIIKGGILRLVNDCLMLGIAYTVGSACSSILIGILTLLLLPLVSAFLVISDNYQLLKDKANNKITDYNEYTKTIKHSYIKILPLNILINIILWVVFAFYVFD